MKILSWNINGIRACFAKNALHQCIAKHTPDILFFQEIKASHHQITEIENAFSEYACFWNPAEKAGYSGTAVWVKKTTFQNVHFFTSIPEFTDSEGRVAGVQINDFVLLGVYFPNGGKSAEAWQEKLWFYDHFEKEMQKLHKSGKKVIFCGDINVAHTERDLARPKDNEGVIGFHPLERAAIDRWIANGWCDVWREKNPDTMHQYSWWTYRAGARERNVGWRIDSFFVQKSLMPHVKTIEYDIHQLGSDHCPLVLELCTQEHLKKH